MIRYTVNLYNTGCKNAKECNGTSYHAYRTSDELKRNASSLAKKHSQINTAKERSRQAENFWAAHAREYFVYSIGFI
jgi:hypothetical protein